MADLINVEVAYALPDKQSLLPIEVASGCTVEEAIVASGILKLYAEIDLSNNKVGIWNRTAKLTETLQQGDRIEIYRPLIADPKEVRKRRAEKAKLEGRADKVTGGRPNKLRSE
ncbi:RnfH family protein [Alteromonas facilis]|uniref:RnfH family protein n=1 Tax=Alteromonas facilis TaxID=2048004 RepID=UPI000C28F0E3|nr:RnfH family protein [Alteromonas facilis]